MANKTLLIAVDILFNVSEPIGQCLLTHSSEFMIHCLIEASKKRIEGQRRRTWTMW